MVHNKAKQLVARIKLQLKDFDEYHLQTLMRHIETNFRKIADGGVYATFKK